jgi:hypothetical protein
MISFSNSLKHHTGGSGTDPVRVVYCLKISFGVGPIKKKPSKMPDSNIQCVVTSGTSVLSLFDFVPKKLVIVEKKF